MLLIHFIEETQVKCCEHTWQREYVSEIVLEVCVCVCVCVRVLVIIIVIVIVNEEIVYTRKERGERHVVRTALHGTQRENTRQEHQLSGQTLVYEHRDKHRRETCGDEVKQLSEPAWIDVKHLMVWVCVHVSVHIGLQSEIEVPIFVDNGDGLVLFVARDEQLEQFLKNSVRFLFEFRDTSTYQ